MTKNKVTRIWDGVGFIHGVPARDMTEKEWRALEAWQRQALSAHYVELKQEPPTAKQSRQTEEI